jgi:hypothetical protein
MNLCRHGHQFHIDLNISIFNSIAEQLSVFFYRVRIHFASENTSGRRNRSKRERERNGRQCSLARKFEPFWPVFNKNRSCRESVLDAYNSVVCRIKSGPILYKIGRLYWRLKRTLDLRVFSLMRSSFSDTTKMGVGQHRNPNGGKKNFASSDLIFSLLLGMKCTRVWSTCRDIAETAS